MSVLTPSLIKTRGLQAPKKTVIQQKWLVKTTAFSDGVGAAKLAVVGLGMPQAGYFLLNKLDGERTENPLIIQVETEWEYPLDGATNPLTKPSVLSSNWEELQEIYLTDSIGAHSITSAGELLATAPTRKNWKPVLRIVKNLADWPLLAYDALKGTRNADAVTIKGITFASNTLLFYPPEIEEVWETVNNVVWHYYKTVFRLAADHNQHVDSFEDRGFIESDVLGGVTVYFNIMKDNQRPTAPWPLDGSGHALADSTGTPATISLQPYGSVTWGLGFD